MSCEVNSYNGVTANIKTEPEEESVITIKEEDGVNPVKKIKIYEVENTSNPHDLNVSEAELYCEDSLSVAEENNEQNVSITSEEADKIAAELTHKFQMNLMQLHCVQRGGSKSANHKIVESKNACPNCKKVFGTGYSLLTHYHSYQNQMELVCYICDIEYKDLLELKNHTHEMHGSKRLYKCDQCGKIFKVFPKFKQHFKIHLGIKDFACDQCNYTSNKKQNLNKHKLIHGSEAVKCRICGKSLKATTSMKRHMAQHGNSEQALLMQSDDEPAGKCPYCDRVFKKGALLKRHLEQHGEKPECIICSTNFTSAKHLRTHKIAKHSRIMQCYMCNYITEQLEDLRMHFGSHNEEDKALPHTYKCYACSFSSVDEKEMIAHNDLGHRTIVCRVCDKGFLDEAHLATHMKFKHVSKDYQCANCNCYFSGEKVLQKHESKCIAKVVIKEEYIETDSD